MPKTIANYPEDEAFARFVAHANRQPMLEPAEEIALGEAVGLEKDDKLRPARDRLVNSHLRLVVKVARKFIGSGLPLQDLVQEGTLGLIAAAERFEPSKGRFATYAWWWIRESIRAYSVDNRRTIRIPTSRARQISALNATINSLSTEGKSPGLGEIAEKMGKSVKEIQDLLLFSREPISLNAFVGEGSAEVGDFIADENAIDAEEQLIQQDRVKNLLTLLEDLDDRERQVLILRFGLDGDGERTLEEIGSVFSVSKERIRQIEAKALGRLRDRGANRLA